MPVRLAYTRPHRLARLHDELLAAGITPERVEGNGDDVWLTVPDGTSAAAVNAVVAAHDPAAIDAAKQANEQAVTAARALVVQTAQTAVGVAYGSLTAAQVRALLAVLLWREGALAADGTVKPLSSWVRSQP